MQEHRFVIKKFHNLSLIHDPFYSNILIMSEKTRFFLDNTKRLHDSSYIHDSFFVIMMSIVKKSHEVALDILFIELHALHTRNEWILTEMLWTWHSS